MANRISQSQNATYPLRRVSEYDGPEQISGISPTARLCIHNPVPDFQTYCKNFRIPAETIMRHVQNMFTHNVHISGVSLL
jgi:hypothetical protein